MKRPWDQPIQSHLRRLPWSRFFPLPHHLNRFARHQKDETGPKIPIDNVGAAHALPASLQIGFDLSTRMELLFAQR